eukprot:scaffold203469_cov66-Cyclotella_meneghiniana.AAC.5
MIADSSLVTALVGIATSCIVFRMLRWKLTSRDDIILSVLAKTAPDAASEQLSDSVMTCERKLNGVNLIITKGMSSGYPKVADYIFNGRSQKNYTRRPACIEGLKKLGMHEQGLIWNNATSSWRRVRSIFQMCLNDENIAEAVRAIKKSAVDLIESSRDEETASDYSAMGINELEYINAVVNYFKAWEYFLLRPQTYWDRTLVHKHSIAVGELQKHVCVVVSVCLFVFYPMTEIMSAAKKLGVDTSSVTAYYTILGLSSDQALQAELRQDIAATALSPSKSKLLRSVIDETLRFKPVGPVVLREAVDKDTNFPGGIKVEKGTAILIHLADMNRCENHWTDPASFCPRRFLHHENGECTKFFPFGNGPKGCIGMHLGRREVTAILEEVVMNYSLEIPVGDSNLDALETHWDIANQPENPTKIKVQRM